MVRTTNETNKTLKKVNAHVIASERSERSNLRSEIASASPRNDRISERALRTNCIGTIIKNLREQQGRRGAELARVTGIDPRTLAAIESGRIKNPSLDSIEAIARALHMSTSEFFALAESKVADGVYHGSQKGEAVIDFHEQGFRMVSYTPLVHEFFIGKVMLAGGAQIETETLPLKTCVFIQLIMGKLVVRAGLKEYFLKEGDHFLISRYVSRTLANPGHREASFSLTTIPSLLKF